MSGVGVPSASADWCQLTSPESSSDFMEGGMGAARSSPIAPIGPGATSSSTAACSATYRATPRSPWAALWVPRASSQTEPGARDISARGLPDPVGLGALLRNTAGFLQRGPDGRQLLLDPREPLIQGLELAADVGDRLDRGGPE